VEVLLRVTDETARGQLAAVLEAAVAPDVRCWRLGADGAWTRSGERDYQAGLVARAGEHAG
jgi:polyphosphate kinase